MGIVVSIGKLAPYLLLAAALGAAAVLLRPEPPPAAKPVPADWQRDASPVERAVSVTAQDGVAPSSSARDLESRLEREIAARQALERQVDTLARELAELRESLESTEAGAVRSAADAGSGSGDDPLDRREWFDEQALVNAGIDALQAETLRRFYEELELERLTLRDQARREDWRNGELRMALQTLDNREQELRDQLGDAAYDAYLYAAGRPNRLVVTSVLESAPAGQAGIVTGDRIVGYDNRRIYNWRDLRNAMSGGSITDTVEIEVERDGHSLQFYLNRGPLGVRTDSQSLAP
jgi:hypothetical protein